MTSRRLKRGEGRPGVGFWIGQVCIACCVYTRSGDVCLEINAARGNYQELHGVGERRHEGDAPPAEYTGGRR